MSSALLRVVYEGVPVRVEPDDITRSMRVPNLGHDGSERRGSPPAMSALRLFRHATVEGALLVPKCLTVVPYAYDTDERHDLMLLACPTPRQLTGVTSGWFAVEQLARKAHDTRSDGDPAVVREALEVMASRINAALWW